MGDQSTRQRWASFEPLHAVVYFAPEIPEADRALGLKGFWMSYFAGRAAPLGPVGPEVVTATFFNFAPADGGSGAARCVGVRLARGRAGHAARLGRPSAASRAGRSPRQLRDGRARRVGAGPRPTDARSRAGPLPRRGPRSRHRRSPTSSSGWPSRCCASTGATDTSRRSSRRASTAARRTCCWPRSGRSPGSPSWVPGAGPTGSGMPPPPDWPIGGSSSDGELTDAGRSLNLRHRVDHRSAGRGSLVRARHRCHRSVRSGSSRRSPPGSPRPGC